MSDSTWRVTGASVRGTSHAATDTPCQDAHAWQAAPDGTLVVAVADGAGSAERSHDGARRAADTALAALVAAVEAGSPADDAEWREMIAAAFSAARSAVLDLATADEVPPRALATTLSCAVAAEGWLAAGQVGDGAVVGAAAGQLFAATTPQRGEYANETTFLTASDALDQLEITVRPGTVDALAATTDGLMRLALVLPSGEPFAPFFEPLLAHLAGAAPDDAPDERLVAFLDSERVNARTDDDKTLVLAVRRRSDSAR